MTEQRDHERRQEALLTLGDRLRDLGSIAAITATASRIVGETLGASRAGFGRFDDAQDMLDVSPGWTAAGQREIGGSHRLAEYGDILTDLKHGQPLVIGDVLTDPRTAGSPGALQAIGVRAQVNMPVRDRGRLVALFFVHDDKPRVWTSEDLAFLSSVADRVEASVARLQADEGQHLLNQELSHRLKKHAGDRAGDRDADAETGRRSIRGRGAGTAADGAGGGATTCCCARTGSAPTCARSRRT